MMRKDKASSKNIIKFLVLSFSFAFCVLRFAIPSFAQEITILYTGSTHAMLYPCSCPKEPDGGIARRAALIRQLKKGNPNTLVLDSGGFFAGGLLDQYTQNAQLDSGRSSINLKAMELMKYDALALGSDEFNFGRQFLQDNINKTNLSFLSCNVKAEKILPYIIKEVAGLKIGIAAVTSAQAAVKTEGLEFIELQTAVNRIVSELKKKQVNVIVLLSTLGENEDLNLIKEIRGIDILITGQGRHKEESFTKIADTLVLRTSWQGRRLGKLSFTVTDNKIINHKVEELRLSDKIADDPEALAILPRCFSDNNCKKEGLIGTCKDPGALSSSCLFSKADKIDLLVIAPKECISCNTETVTNSLKKEFPGLAVSYLYYPDTKASKLIKDFSIRALPAYLLGKEIEKEKGFSSLSATLERNGDYYILNPQVSGISYFLDRQKVKNRLDLFLSLYDKDTVVLLDAVKEFGPHIHFLAAQQGGVFDAQRGNLEVEEYLRAVCVQKYYPQKFWDYISCRGKFISSSWWEDCLGESDIGKIKSCARAEEGKSLLGENISLNRELRVMAGPTCLSDNQEIFGIQGVPSKEALRKILKR